MTEHVTLTFDVSPISMVDRVKMAIQFLKTVQDDKLFEDVDYDDQCAINNAVRELEEFVKP